MAKYIYPSSFECDCKFSAHFFENSIKEMKRMSTKKEITVGEEDHKIIFYKGNAIKMICPKLGEVFFD